MQNLKQLNVEQLTQNWPVVLASSTFWFSLTFIADWASKRLSTSYRMLEKPKQTQWNISLTSLVHATLICSLSFHIVFNDTALKSDRIFGKSPMSELALSIACGYFIWDTLISLWHIMEYGPSFLFHGISCLLVYSITLGGPVFHFYACFFLLFELSTPFLNIMYLLDKSGLGNSIYQIVNGMLMVSVFFGMRIVAGFIMSYQLLWDIYANYHKVGAPRSILFILIDIFLCSLNLFWLYKMIMSVSKRTSERRRRRSSKAE
eukprot:Partr_v1_DN24271_c1_g1_i2_m36587 putative Family with sequence similarity 57, member